MLGFWVFTVVMEVMSGRERERGRETKIREKHKYILLCKYIILMYCIRKLGCSVCYKMCAYPKYGYWAQPLFGLTIYLYCGL